MNFKNFNIFFCDLRHNFKSKKKQESCPRNDILISGVNFLEIVTILIFFWD